MKGNQTGIKRQTPALIAGFFMGGIMYAKFAAVPSSMLLFSVLFLCALLLFVLNRSIANTSLSTFIVSVLFFLLGSISYTQLHRSVTPPPFIPDDAEQAIVYGKVSGLDLAQGESFTFIIETSRIYIKEKDYKANVRLRVSARSTAKFNARIMYNKLHNNDTLILQGNLSTGYRKGNPGEFNYGEYLNREGLSGQLRYDGTGIIKILHGDSNSLTEFRRNLRTTIHNRIGALFGKQSAPLVNGLLLGDRTEIPDEVNREFINAGVAHVLAVSGLNVAFVGYGILLLCGRFPLRIRYGIVVLAVFVFWFIAGNTPPVNRAVLMCCLVALNAVTGRKVESLHILFTTAFLSLLFAPDDLFSPSFQLSFSGVFALLYGYPALLSIVGQGNAITKKVLRLLLMTFVAQIGTLPFTTYYFGKVSLTAIAANFLVVPLISGIMGGAIMALTISTLIPVLGVYAAAGVDAIVRFTFFITEMSGGNFAWVAVESYTIAAGALTMVLFVVWILVQRNFLSRIASITLLLLVSGLIVVIHAAAHTPLFTSGKLNVLFIDVGQGDASLLQFPDGTTMLIDAGNATMRYDAGIARIVPLLDRLGIKQIDFALITHYDADHYHGIAGLLKNRRVKHVLLPPGWSRPVPDSLIKRLANITGAHYGTPADTIWDIGNARVYFMDNKSGAKFCTTLNDRSLAVKVVYGNTSVLFTGDAQEQREKLWLQSITPLLSATVLKIGHHGSRYGSSPAFISAVRPQAAIISCGKRNIYGHPHKEVLQRLAESRVLVYRTDMLGGISMSSDGVSWKFTEKAGY